MPPRCRNPEISPAKGVSGPTLIQPFCQWGWILSVTVACASMLLGFLTDDHRLASRSAAMLLITIALMSLEDLLG